MNRKQLTYRLAINHFADHSPSELRRLRGRSVPKRGGKAHKNNGKAFVSKVHVRDLPAEMNWRLRGQLYSVHTVLIQIFWGKKSESPPYDNENK